MIFFPKHIITVLCLAFMCWVANTNAQDTLIRSGDLWKYLDDGSYPGRAWTEQHFSIEGWKEGPSPLGYGYDDLGTEINFSETLLPEKEAKKFITSYFKKKIILNNVDAYAAYKISYKRDDGAIIYINNQEVTRSNMPSGRVNNKTQSSDIVKGREEHLELTQYIESSLLFEGLNTIAVEIHQRMQTSTDIILDFKLIGIKDVKELHEFIAKDQGKINNGKLEILDLKHELSEEVIRNDLNSKIIQAQWLVIGLGILLIGVTCFLFYRYYLRQRTLVEAHQAERKESDKLIKSKNQESINLTIANIRNKNFFKEIKLELLQLIAANKGGKNEMNHLIHRIDIQSQDEEDWERMKLHLDSIYSGFFEKLSHQYPVLSQQELKHCGFIKLRLDTKEISQILRIDPKSVQAARYRIKKKMNLRENQDLKSTIVEF